MNANVVMTRPVCSNGIITDCQKTKRQFKITVADNEETVYFIYQLVKNIDKYLKSDYESNYYLPTIEINTSIFDVKGVAEFISMLKNKLKEIDHIPEITINGVDCYTETIMW